MARHATMQVMARHATRDDEKDAGGKLFQTFPNVSRIPIPNVLAEQLLSYKNFRH